MLDAILICLGHVRKLPKMRDDHQKVVRFVVDLSTSGASVNIHKKKVRTVRLDAISLTQPQQMNNNSTVDDEGTRLSPKV